MKHSRLALAAGVCIAAGAAALWYGFTDPACPDGVVATVAGSRACLNPGESFRDGETAPEMVVIADGSYSTTLPADGLDRPEDTGPLHEITIDQPFAAGRFEVTYEDWDACAADNICDADKPSDHGWARERKPIIDVTWQEVSAYIAWLSEKTGVDYRLLTESEWEYAARLGAPDRFGLEHLRGTAWEWVGECWRPPGEDGALRYNGDCLRRVHRDGTWADAYRYDASEPITYAFAGFRVARTIAPDQP